MTQAPNMHTWEEVAIGVERMRVRGGWIYGWTQPPSPLWAVFVPDPLDAAEARERRLREALQEIARPIPLNHHAPLLFEEAASRMRQARAALEDPPDA